MEKSALILMIIISFLLSSGIVWLTKRFYYVVDVVLGVILLFLSSYLLLFLYGLSSIIRGSVQELTSSTANMTLVDFFRDSLLFILIVLPIFIASITLLWRGIRRSESKQLRNGLMIAAALLACIYAGFSIGIQQARVKAYAAIVVGDNEAKINQTFATAPNYSSVNCHQECIKTIWFTNPLLVSQKKWIFQLNANGIVLAKYE